MVVMTMIRLKQAVNGYLEKRCCTIGLLYKIAPYSPSILLINSTFNYMQLHYAVMDWPRKYISIAFLIDNFTLKLSFSVKMHQSLLTS